jgi:hypothetical protein
MYLFAPRISPESGERLRMSQMAAALSEIETGEQTMTTMPIFVFARRRDIEHETGLILAGQLVVDIPKSKKPKRREQQMVAEIIQRLTADARSGQMPDDAFVCGWHGGRRPEDAVDVHDDVVMASWARDRLVIAVRIDPRNDGQVRIDSDILLQADLLKRQ